MVPGSGTRQKAARIVARPRARSVMYAFAYPSYPLEGVSRDTFFGKPSPQKRKSGRAGQG